MEDKEAIAEEWLGRVLRSFPPQTVQFLARVDDPFRNPVGHTLRESVAILLDELFLAMTKSRVTAALDSIMQIRAVQDLAPSQALEFLFQLRDILRRHATGKDLELLEARIDELALLAFDLYVKYRERAWEARANEVRRRVYVLERVMETGRKTNWQERGAP